MRKIHFCYVIVWGFGALKASMMYINTLLHIGGNNWGWGGGGKTNEIKD